MTSNTAISNRKVFHNSTLLEVSKQAYVSICPIFSTFIYADTANGLVVSIKVALELMIPKTRTILQIGITNHSEVILGAGNIISICVTIKFDITC